MNVSREILINFVGSCDPRAAPPTRLASQCAGVARPASVLNGAHQGVSPLRGRSFAPLMWPSRIPPRIGWKTVLGVIFAVFSQFFAFLAYC